MITGPLCKTEEMSLEGLANELATQTEALRKTQTEMNNLRNSVIDYETKIANMVVRYVAIKKALLKAASAAFDSDLNAKIKTQEAR